MLFACRSAGTGPQPSPTAEASATEPGPSAAQQPEGETPRDESTSPRLEQAKNCAAGSTTIAEPNLCLKLPPGYEATDARPGVQVFTAQDAPPITVRWQPTTKAFTKTYADALARLAELDTRAIQGATRGGDGTFVYAIETQPQALQVAHASSTLQCGERIAWCEASAPVHAKLPRAFFEACQSLMTPG
jgi:hypothetical protein